MERRPLTAAKEDRSVSARGDTDADTTRGAVSVGCLPGARRATQSEIRRVVESNGLVTQNEPRLFELQVTMRVIDVRAAGWDASSSRPMGGGASPAATRGRDVLTLYYQSVPAALSRDSHTAPYSDHTRYKLAG